MITEHSLYGFRSLSEIHFNRACRYFLRLCDQVIAVSKTTRNNIILRGQMKANQVVVIPNGVSNISHIRDKRMQSGQCGSQKGNKIRIISVGRMTYRRGTDLLIEILP